LPSAAPQTTSIAASLAAAGDWFLHSGIQSPDGGVSRYRLNAEGRNLPVSNEITGYTASAYAWLYEFTGEERYREAARRTARFLVDAAWDAKGEQFPFENSPGSPAYFFDCGIIVRGLLAVHRITGETRFLDIAAACGRSMIRDFLAGAAIHPIVDWPSRRPWPYEKRWSREPGCFQLKSAMAWLNLHTATGEPGFADAYERAAEMALANFRSFLPGTEEHTGVMDRLHAFSYFLEGILPHPRRAEALPEAIAMASRWLREIRGEFERSDVNAQLLRARLYAGALGVCPLDEAAAEEEAAAVAGYQQENGSFCFGSRNGKPLPFDNPVSTAFCMQALALWGTRKLPPLESLI
jgi:hypothetical protein